MCVFFANNIQNACLSIFVTTFDVNWLWKTFSHLKIFRTSQDANILEWKLTFDPYVKKSVGKMMPQEWTGAAIASSTKTWYRQNGVIGDPLLHLWTTQSNGYRFRDDNPLISRRLQFLAKPNALLFGYDGNAEEKNGRTPAINVWKKEETVAACLRSLRAVASYSKRHSGPLGKRLKTQ